MTTATTEGSAVSQSTKDGERGSGARIPDWAWGSVEAILMSSDRAIKARTILDALALLDEGPKGVEESELDRVIDGLNDQYDESGRSFRIQRVAAGYRVMTEPEHAPVVAALNRARIPARLTRAQLETLSIIAYRQPVTRAELEAIRGVACGDVVRALMDRGMVKITGRAEELGRPMLYGTTTRFLDTFGLSSIKDLPGTGDDVEPVLRD